jgi:hypothetical protein
MSNKWREIKEGKTIFKFDKDKEAQTIVLTFLGEGKIKHFTVKQFDNVGNFIGVKDSIAVEFPVKKGDKEAVFSTGSSRLLEALSSLADDLTGKRIKMVKDGVGMDTQYSASLMK